jgi:hypothetical protein
MHGGRISLNVFRALVLDSTTQRRGPTSFHNLKTPAEFTNEIASFTPPHRPFWTAVTPLGKNNQL